MAEPNENPTQNPAPTAPLARPESGPARADSDDEIDAALSKATRRTAGEPRTAEVSLKRQWDADLEAELEATLEGFDPKSFEHIAAPAALRARAQSARSARPGGQAGPADRYGDRRPGQVASSSTWAARARASCRSSSSRARSSPRPGSTIEVVVERFDPDEGIQILRRKGSAVEASWENLKRGIVVEARVTKVIKGGAEVDVDGIRGFMPISQIDLNRVEDAATYLNQKFKAIVTEANQREKNLVVSRRELLEQERAELRERTWKTLEEGQVREGVVRSVKGFGAFVDLDGVDGLLPIGEMSWSRVGKVDDVVRIGDKVTVKVLKIDRTAQKLTLGLKQLMPSPWENVTEKYPRGTMVKGKVTRTMDFGAFVELEPGVEGLIHISELSPTRVRRVADIVKPEQEVEVRILKVDPEEKKIALSLLPDPRKAGRGADEEDDEEDETPRPPKPEPKVPLKGGLGDRDRGPFGSL